MINSALSSASSSSLPLLSKVDDVVKHKSWARPSELHRALECPASTVLPREEDTEGKAASWGREVHKFVETGETTERVAKWLAAITDNPSTIRDQFWPGGLHEVLLRLDEDGTCRTLTAKTEEERDGFFDGGMVRGVADWVGQSIVPHIDDLKTGRFLPDAAPSETPQLLLYAYVWLTVHPEEPGILLSLTHWPRYPKGQEPVRIGPDYLSREDVQAWYLERVMPARRLAKREGAERDARPGPWCQFCRSAPHCPAL